MDCAQSTRGRVCRVCGVYKMYPAIRKNGPGGKWLRPTCKECENAAARAAYVRTRRVGRDPAKVKANRRATYLRHKDRFLAKAKAFREANRSKVAAYHKKRRLPGGDQSPEAKRLARVMAKRGYKPVKHHAHVLTWLRWCNEQNRKGSVGPKGLHNAHVLLWRSDQAREFRTRYNHDPEFNLRERLRARSRKYSLDAYPYKYAAQLVKGQKRSKRFEQVVGYTVADLKQHLERQFAKGMDWTAFLEGRIHIDHIRPRAAFDLSTPDAVRECWALPNLRPLWAKDNQRKGARIESLV